MSGPAQSRRVLVCGGRDFNDSDAVWNELHALTKRIGWPTLLIHGYASGADTQARIWAETHGVACIGYRADWLLGRKAGPLRNQRMIDEGKPDLVVAFPGGRGTMDMVRRAHDAGIEVVIVTKGGAA